MNDQATPRRIRQRFTVVLGLIGIVVAVVLFIGSMTARQPGAIPYVSVALGCLSYCVLARPWLSSRADGIVVSNVVREVTLPWEGISHATSRGSLVIHDTEGGKTTVWAIGSQKARNQSATAGGEMEGGAAGIRGRSFRPDPSTFAASATSAAALREAIDAEVLDNPPGPSGRQVRWLPVPCLLMGIALVAVVLGIVL